MPSFQAPYCKPVRSPRELVEHLIAKGLTVADREQAESLLERVSHYRFKGYALAFRDGRDPAKPFLQHTSFTDIIARMEFDSQLRLHVMAGIEPIEIAFRTAVNEHMSRQHCSPFWYTEEGLFCQDFDFTGFLSKARKNFECSKELFVRHYREHYDYPYMPPGWMLIEVTTFGMWSKLYAGLLDHVDKDAVADRFGPYPHAVFASWMHCISTLRNLCAHHGRLWNKIFGVQPKIPRGYSLTFATDKRRFATHAYVMKSLLNPLGRGQEWSEGLKTLLRPLNAETLYQMGFSPSWANDPFWKA